MNVLQTLVLVLAVLTKKIFGTSCLAIWRRCSQSASCNNQRELYISNCETVYEQDGQICNRKCKRSFKELLDYPEMTGFTECSCSDIGDERRVAACLTQKCRLLESCLGQECTERGVEEEPSADTEPRTLSTSGQSITMSMSTIALSKMNCEAVIMTCNDDRICKNLLDTQTNTCKSFDTTGTTGTRCSVQCTRANQALIENDIGHHLQSCRFESVDRTAGQLAVRFSALIKTCIWTKQTQSPSFTEAIIRPYGDCKKHYDECNHNDACTERYTALMDQCRGTTGCVGRCRSAIKWFTQLQSGAALWNCHCNSRHASKNCERIRVNMKYCREDPFTTDDSSIPTTAVGPTTGETYSRFYRLNYTCEDSIRVRIEYSAEMTIPTITAEDKKCLASLKGTAMELELGYIQGKCGTVREVLPDKHVRYKNRIYVRSTDFGRYDEIGAVDCPAKVEETIRSGNVDLGMKFYTDDQFTTAFRSDSNGAIDLGTNKTVHVGIELTSDTRDDIILNTCYATPNGEPDYPHRYFFLRSGCEKDPSLIVHKPGPARHLRFSFFRIQFSDLQYNGQVYIHCEMNLCSNEDPNCKPGCNRSVSYPTQSVSYGPYYFNSRGFRASPLLSILTILWLAAQR